MKAKATEKKGEQYPLQTKKWSLLKLRKAPSNASKSKNPVREVHQQKQQQQQAAAAEIKHVKKHLNTIEHIRV